jgi:hypothetical protein
MGALGDGIAARSYKVSVAPSLMPSTLALIRGMFQGRGHTAPGLIFPVMIGPRPGFKAIVRGKSYVRQSGHMYCSRIGYWFYKGAGGVC